MPDTPPINWQELGDRFHLMIGECIAAWATVDNELFRIFHRCVGPLQQCAIIYSRLPGLDSRFNLVDEIVKSVLPKRSRKSGGHDHPSVKEWGIAKGDYQKLLGVRRRIAHDPVGSRRGAYYYDTGVSFYDVPAPSWFEIYVSEHERLREKDADLPPLLVDDLWTHVGSVGVLSARLHRFYYEVLIKQLEAPPPTNPPQYQD